MVNLFSLKSLNFKQEFKPSVLEQSFILSV